MRFTFTHPMHSHPYNPELVTGSGIATVAAAAEAAGFHGFGFTDHPAPSQRWLESGGHDAVDPFVAMGYAAARTTTLRLIPNIVVLPYRNPFVVAKAGATLDLLSDGRFTLGVGVGYLKGEFYALGVNFDERAALFEEALEVIRGIWTTDDFSYEGRHFSAKGITAHPRPVSTPHPPIWIGGNTSAARKRVVNYGDGWCPFAAPAMLAQTARTAVMDSDVLVEGIDDLRRRFDAADRDFTGIDITYTNADGGSPGSDDFNADAYLTGLEKLAAVGVTWVQVGLPGDSLAHVLETIDRFGSSVIQPAERSHRTAMVVALREVSYVAGDTTHPSRSCLLLSASLLRDEHVASAPTTSQAVNCAMPVTAIAEPMMTLAQSEDGRIGGQDPIVCSAAGIVDIKLVTRASTSTAMEENCRVDRRLRCLPGSAP